MDRSDEPTDSLGNTDKPFDDEAPLHISEPEEPFFVRPSSTTRIIIWSQRSREVIRLRGSDFDFPKTNFPIGWTRSWKGFKVVPLGPRIVESCNIEGTDVFVQRKKAQRQPGRLTTHVQKNPLRISDF